jgi:hypothetical protein
MRLICFLLILFGISTQAFAHEGPHEKQDSIPPKMSKLTYAVGGVIGTYPGYGLGHLIQGRWQESGWKFTAGELAGVSLIGLGLAQCSGDIEGNWITKKQVHAVIKNF